MVEEQAREALDRLQEAMRTQRGPIDDLRHGLIYENPYLRMSRDAFVFDTPGGARFRYDLGGVVMLNSPSAELDAECRLYKWGTVYGTIAWMNGLIPLHASCVTDGAWSVAFTAQSGVGKSTLAAALASSGWYSVCDDTLAVAHNANAFFALPDHTPAKLSTETAQKLGFDAGEAVPLASGKSYVELPKVAAIPLPIRDLILLEDGPEWEIIPVTGADKVELIGSSLYRGFVHSALHSHQEHAQLMLQLAGGFRCWRMARPRTLGGPQNIAERAGELLSSLEH